jgi:ABC-type branched-subunit amino acid transport system substrate-binding protein
MIMIDRRSVFLGLSAAPFLTRRALSEAASAETYKVGFLMPLTGGSGKLGQMMLEGSQLAVDEINAAGSRKIELIAEDSQALAKNGIDGFRKLAEVDKVPFVITGWTAVVAAIAPLATESKVYLLSASSASPALRSVSPYFQSTWMFDDETVRLILPYAAQKLNVAKLGLLTEVSDLGAALGASIKKEWSRLGKELSIEESFQSKETNFRPSLLKILATKPDAIYNTSSNGKLSAQVVRQARELGYEGIFLSYGAFEDPEILAIGKQAEKCFYTSPTFDTTAGNEATKKFVDAFTRKHGRPPNIHQANHYDLVQLFSAVAANLAREKTPLTGQAFRTELTSKFPTYDGAAGRYRFNFADGSVIRSTVVKTVKDGAFVKVADLD